MKKNLLALALVTLVSANLFATPVDSASKTTIANTDSTFELYNKDSMLDFKLEVDGGTVLKSDWGTTPRRFTLQEGGNARAQIRVTDPSRFVIYLEIYNSRGTDKYTLRPAQKTTFVSYSGTHSPALYPQTGPLKGLLGKTESGLPLKNNLKATDIAQGDKRPSVSTSPQKKTYYDVLGVSRTATADEIKKAYRKLVFLRHPDKPGGSQALFTELNTANAVLSDPDQKAAYDRTLPR